MAIRIKLTNIGVQQQDTRPDLARVNHCPPMKDGEISGGQYGPSRQ
jgi:hypothetical protein